VTDVNRNVALLTGAVLGAGAALLLRRRQRLEPGAAPAADPRAEELRRKLDEARRSPADEDDFEVAGMGAETMVDEPRPPGGPSEPLPPAHPPTEVPPDEFEAMRRRVHEEARAAAEEMRRRSEPEG
jgi:hypothetical protein